MQNIVLDFTGDMQLQALTMEQPLAIMPAALAKRLLSNYAKSLKYASGKDIIDQFIASLRHCGDDTSAAVGEAFSFIQERTLIENVISGNWDAYTVNPQEDAKILVMEEEKPKFVW